MSLRRSGLGFELLLFGLALLCAVAGYGLPDLARSAWTPGPREEGELRVLTWNVGDSLAAGGGALSYDAIGHVAEILRSSDADLCILQELAGDNQLGSLLRALGSEWSGEISQRGSGRRVAILTPRGQLKDFRVESRSRQHRSLGVEYKRPSGRSVIAIGVHAHAFAANDRNAHLGAAADLLTQIAPGLPKILAGDFNIDLDLDKRGDLFTDDEHRDVETYNYVANRFTDAARGTGSTAEPDRRLDYIFIDAQTLSVRSAGPWKGRRVGNMDHDPVVADLVVR